MSDKHYNYAYASGLYKGILRDLPYLDIPGVKIVDFDKFKSFLAGKKEQAEQLILKSSNHGNGPKAS